MASMGRRVVNFTGLNPPLLGGLGAVPAVFIGPVASSGGPVFSCCLQAVASFLQVQGRGLRTEQSQAAASTKARICSGTRTNGLSSNSIAPRLLVLRRVAAALLRGLLSALRHCFAAAPHSFSLQNFARLLELVRARPHVWQQRAAVVGSLSSSSSAGWQGELAGRPPAPASLTRGGAASFTTLILGNSNRLDVWKRVSF